MSTLDRFRQLFSTAAPDRPFVCCGCGERYEVEYHICPACDSFSVERLLQD